MKFELSIPVPKGEANGLLYKLRKDMKKRYPHTSTIIKGMDDEFLIEEGARSLITERVRIEFDGIEFIPAEVSLKVSKDNVIPLTPTKAVEKQSTSSAYNYSIHSEGGKASIYQPTSSEASFFLNRVKNMNRFVLNREFKPHVNSRAVRKEPFMDAVAKLVDRFQFIPSTGGMSNKNPSTTKAAISLSLGLTPKHPKAAAMVEQIKDTAPTAIEPLIAKIKESLSQTDLLTEVNSLLSKDFIAFEDCETIAMSIDSAVNNYALKCSPKALQTLRSEVGDHLRLEGVITKSTYGYSQRRQYDYQLSFQTTDNENVVFVSGTEFKIPRDELRSVIGKENVIVHGEVLSKVEPVSNMFAGSTTMKLHHIEIPNKPDVTLENKKTQTLKQRQP